ncbi:pyridoxal phosphate-dependent aminotransferase [Rhizobium leguminosarum]
MIPIIAPPNPTGNVFKKLETGIDLRTFNEGFLRSFFPKSVISSPFSHDCWFKYGDTQGDPELRAFIATQIGLSPENILITDGASQALFLAIFVILSRNDTLFLPKPVFPAYTRIAAMRECVVEYYPCDDAGATLRDRITAFPEGSQGSIIINYPHNPTGLALGTTALAEIVTLAACKGIQILLDDTYHWLTGNIDQFTKMSSIANEVEQTGNMIAIASLGKFLCLPGLRLGFLATKDVQLLEKITEAKRHLAHVSCHSSERFALNALNSGSWRLGRANLAKTLHVRRQAFNQAVVRYGVEVKFPAFGFYVYASNIKPLSDRGIVGVAGDIFNGHLNDARYCIAASDTDWRKLLSILEPAT